MPTKAELVAENARVQEKYARLQEKYARLQEKYARVQEENARLRRRVQTLEDCAEMDRRLRYEQNQHINEQVRSVATYAGYRQRRKEQESTNLPRGPEAAAEERTARYEYMKGQLKELTYAAMEEEEAKRLMEAAGVERLSKLSAQKQNKIVRDTAGERLTTELAAAVGIDANEADGDELKPFRPSEAMVREVRTEIAVEEKTGGRRRES